jgi:hypothetical protein
MSGLFPPHGHGSFVIYLFRLELGSPWPSNKPTTGNELPVAFKQGDGGNSNPFTIFPSVMVREPSLGRKIRSRLPGKPLGN